ncbi:MAG: glycosyltransferase, partial [Verrucomicrobiales bacterium]|nr:glycosyltransferase [Verrucomicrobiales bacterium]
EEFDVHCCCLERPGAFVERLPHPENVHVLGKKSGFSIESVVGLARLIRRLKPDVVHSHNLGPLIYSALGSGFGFSASVIQGEHSLLTAEECTPRRLRQRKLFYRACREIHTVSTQLRDQLLSLNFPANKISVIVNGVDTHRFVPADVSAARAKIGLEKLDPKAFVFGIVGRFGPFKRHAALIEAFNIVARDHSSVHLLIVGDGGPEKERVRQQGANSPVSDRIHFTGFQADVLPFYQSMNLLVVPSENEGMSNAVLEAMSCGIPALAHQMCGNSEIIMPDLDGWISNLDSPEKLASELKNVLAVPAKLLKLKQMAREKVVTSFSIHTMVMQYATLYRRHVRN